MDGWRDEQRTRKQSVRQRDQKGGKREKRERAAQNMRLKCNVLERERERENPGQVMQLEGTAHWQNVERIKKRRRLQTLFLYRLPFDLLLFTHPTAREECCLYNSPFEIQ